MDLNLEIRTKQLDNTDIFIAAAKSKVDVILKGLNWKASKILNDECLMPCPEDPLHKIPSNRIKEHVKKCYLKKRGYADVQFLSEPNYKSGSSIKIDPEKRKEIFQFLKSSSVDIDHEPKTADRLLCAFNTEQRLALYDYVRKMTNGPSKLPEFDLSQPKPKSDKLSEEELKILERNIKRRPVKYKTVSVNRKNYTEVLREVIDNQMDLYKEWISEGGKNTKKDKRSCLKRNTHEEEYNSHKKHKSKH